MVMKKLFIFSVFLLLSLSVVAQIEAVEEENLGITPDSPLYGLENALKRLSLAFTFGKEAKVRKELSHARERLREVKLMVERGNVDAAEKAKIRHKELINKLRVRIDDLDDDPNFETELEIETELEDQENEIEEIETKIEIKRGLSEEQKTRLKAFLEELRSSGSEVKLKIENKKGELKSRLRAKGVGEADIKKRIEDVKDKGLRKSLKLRIEHVKREIEKSKEKLKDADENALGDLNVAKKKLEQATEEIEKGNFEEAKNLINEALKLAVLVRGENNSKLRAVREVLRERSELKQEARVRLDKAKKLLKSGIKVREEDELKKFLEKDDKERKEIIKRDLDKAEDKIKNFLDDLEENMEEEDEGEEDDNKVLYDNVVGRQKDDDENKEV
ncbi:MAG: hypothetical protein CMH63_03570 [Nanoarchaeota archaeon]|nr:hypothetical protein [Nanoarchaeota archaeon]|tara:strand:- start:13537 stop:14703 length:1167 start_codon:yes stop_codon:yes gene_type:complete